MMGCDGFCLLYCDLLANLAHRRTQQIRAAAFASFAYTDQAGYAVRSEVRDVLLSEPQGASRGLYIR
jgi:hypothetical protein